MYHQNELMALISNYCMGGAENDCGPIQIGDSQRQLVKKKTKTKKTNSSRSICLHFPDLFIYLFIYLFFRQPQLEVQAPTTRTPSYSKFKMQSTYRIS